MPANLENSAVATRLGKVSFHSNPKERQRQSALCAALQVFLPSLGAFLLTYRMIYHPFISSVTSPTCSSALIFFLYYGKKKKEREWKQSTATFVCFCTNLPSHICPYAFCHPLYCLCSMEGQSSLYIFPLPVLRTLLLWLLSSS